MHRFQNAMEVFKLLEQSNCRECNEATCLAFAGAVFTGRRNLNECSRLPSDVLARYGEASSARMTVEQEMDQAIATLKAKIRGIDLAEAADRVDGVYTDGKLNIRIFGKDFRIDDAGNLSSDIHVNPWLVIPVLSYVLECKGEAVRSEWVPFRELKSGRDWYRLFGQRCEKPMKKLADTHPDFFGDLIALFNGRQVENHYESDIALVLSPLPRLPMLICYWKPDDGMESDLNLFFDSTAEDNLPVGSIFALATGLMRMFEKIALRHGTDLPNAR